MSQFTFDQASSFKSDAIQVRGWRHDGVAMETHRGTPHPIPKHAHNTYQIGITTRDPGEYLCDGKVWHAAPGSIIMFNPGQVHSAPKPSHRSDTAISRIMFVNEMKMAEVSTMLSDGGHSNLPAFVNLVINDPSCIKQFKAIHEMAGQPHTQTQLKLESMLMLVLSSIVTQYASLPEGKLNSLCGSKARMRDVKEYLEVNFAKNISLTELAEVAGLSPYHMTRTFSQEFGMPPHAYQTQLRVQHARDLLLAGSPVADAALTAGFFDQSHFTRHFRRIIGVPPRQYVS